MPNTYYNPFVAFTSLAPVALAMLGLMVMSAEGPAFAVFAFFATAGLLLTSCLSYLSYLWLKAASVFVVGSDLNQAQELNRIAKRIKQLETNLKTAGLSLESPPGVLISQAWSALKEVSLSLECANILRFKSDSQGEILKLVKALKSFDLLEDTFKNLLEEETPSRTLFDFTTGEESKDDGIPALKTTLALNESFRDVQERKAFRERGYQELEGMLGKAAR